MPRNRYFAIAAVAGTSLVAAALLPHGKLLQALAAIPLFGALTAAAVEILREQIRRHHELALAESKNRFDLAASSHMASIAFDKHVAFCEEYVTEVLAALKTLFREGPTKEALKHSDQLHIIKQKHILWITRDLEARLDPFERALRRIGAADFVSRQFPESDGHAQRTTDMFKYFAQVLGTEHMGPEWEGEAISDQAAVSRVISHLRDILGVEELTQLRTAIVDRARLAK